MTRLSSFDEDGPVAGRTEAPATAAPRRYTVPDGDTGVADTGAPDAGAPETGGLDIGRPDTGGPDTGTTETGGPDTGAPAKGGPDTGAAAIGGPAGPIDWSVPSATTSSGCS